VAELLAISAIDQALVKFNNEPTWEMTYLFDTEYPATPISANGGTFTWKLIDLGGDQKRLDGIGRVGDAECILSVSLGSSSTSEGLQVPLLCGGYLQIAGGSRPSTLHVNGGPACTNGDLDNGNILSGDVEAQTDSFPGTVTGTRTVPGTVRGLPNSSIVFDYYMREGTVIPADSLPLNSGLDGRQLKGCVLSPDNNPYGAADPDGIYIIDNPGIDIEILECRIVGTIIVRNPGYQVEIIDYINWEPARGNWPALIVEGNLFIHILAGDLTETIARTNLNPPGTPYQGSTDGDTSDSYRNAMAGILYATGNVTIDGGNRGNSFDLEGLLICGGWCRIEREAVLVFNYDNSAALNPPPGFGPGDASSIVGGSWRRTTSP
jgi:hypothetical protein